MQEKLRYDRKYITNARNSKKQKEIGDLTYIALGKYKYPNSIKEAYKQFKTELCR